MTDITTLGLHRHVRFTLTAEAGEKALDAIGRHERVLKKEGNNTYICTLFDLLSLFGRHMHPRPLRGETKPESECLFEGASIELMPPTDKDVAIYVKK